MVVEEAFGVFQDSVDGIGSWNRVACGEAGEEARICRELLQEDRDDTVCVHEEGVDDVTAASDIGCEVSTAVRGLVEGDSGQ